MTGPDPNSIYPNENVRQVVYIKNVITRPKLRWAIIPTMTM